jgi:hypothetical protein
MGRPKEYFLGREVLDNLSNTLAPKGLSFGQEVNDEKAHAGMITACALNFLQQCEKMQKPGCEPAKCYSLNG